MERAMERRQCDAINVLDVLRPSRFDPHNFSPFSFLIPMDFGRCS